MAEFLQDWLRSFGSELDDLGRRGALTQDWLISGSWNSFSWLHSRIFGALVRSIDRPLIPMIETRWGRGFVPDLLAVEAVPNSKEDLIRAVIEYESTNSSDWRVVEKDLAHFREAIKKYQTGEYTGQIPQWWIVITTLPACEVRNWPWWDGGEGRAERNQNPLCYYEDSLHKEFKAAWKLIEASSSNLAWVNLAPIALKVMNLNGELPEGSLEVPLTLPVATIS